MAEPFDPKTHSDLLNAIHPMDPSEALDEVRKTLNETIIKAAPSERTADFIGENIFMAEATQWKKVEGILSKEDWFKQIDADLSPEELAYLKKHMKWGCYGEKGDQPCNFVPVEELSVDHIKKHSYGYAVLACMGKSDFVGRFNGQVGRQTIFLIL